MSQNGVKRPHQDGVREWPMVPLECKVLIRPSELLITRTWDFSHEAGSRKAWERQGDEDDNDEEDDDDEMLYFETDVELCELMEVTLDRMGLSSFCHEHKKPLFVPRGLMHLTIKRGERERRHFLGTPSQARQALMWCLCCMRGGISSRERVFNASSLWNRLPDLLQRDLLFSMSTAMQRELIPLSRTFKNSLGECMVPLMPVGLASPVEADTNLQQEATRRNCHRDRVCDNSEFLGFYLVISAWVISNLYEAHNEFLHLICIFREVLTQEQIQFPSTDQLFPPGDLPLCLTKRAQRIESSLDKWRSILHTHLVDMVRVLRGQTAQAQAETTRVLFHLLGQFESHYVMHRGHLRSLRQKPDRHKGRGSLVLRSYEAVYSVQELIPRLMQVSSTFVAELARVHSRMQTHPLEFEDAQSLVIHGTLPWEFVSTVSALMGSTWKKTHIRAALPFYSKEDQVWCTAAVVTHWPFFLLVAAVKWYQSFDAEQGQEVQGVSAYSPVLLQVQALFTARGKEEVKTAAQLLCPQSADVIDVRNLQISLESKDVTLFLASLGNMHIYGPNIARLTRFRHSTEALYRRHKTAIERLLGLSEPEAGLKLVKDLCQMLDPGEDPVFDQSSHQLHAYYRDDKVLRFCLLSEALPIVTHEKIDSHGSALLWEALHLVKDWLKDESKLVVSQRLRDDAAQLPVMPQAQLSQPFPSGTPVATPHGFPPTRVARPSTKPGAGARDLMVGRAGATDLARHLGLHPGGLGSNSLVPSPYVGPYQ